MDHQIIPVRGQADQIPVWQADFLFIRGEGKGLFAGTAASQQAVHHADNGFRAFFLIDIIIDMEVDGTGLVIVAGCQEDEGHILIHGTDSFSGINTGETFHINIEENQREAVGHESGKQRLAGGKGGQVKAEMTPEGIIIQRTGKIRERFRPVVHKSDVHSGPPVFHYNTRTVYHPAAFYATGGTECISSRKTGRLSRKY